MFSLNLDSPKFSQAQLNTSIPYQLLLKQNPKKKNNLCSLATIIQRSLENTAAVRLTTELIKEMNCICMLSKVYQSDPRTAWSALGGIDGCSWDTWTPRIHRNFMYSKRNDSRCRNLLSGKKMSLCSFCVGYVFQFWPVLLTQTKVSEFSNSYTPAPREFCWGWPHQIFMAQNQPVGPTSTTHRLRYHCAQTWAQPWVPIGSSLVSFSDSSEVPISNWTMSNSHLLDFLNMFFW